MMLVCLRRRKRLNQRWSRVSKTKLKKLNNTIEFNDIGYTMFYLQNLRVKTVQERRNRLYNTSYIHVKRRTSVSVSVLDDMKLLFIRSLLARCWTKVTSLDFEQWYTEADNAPSSAVSPVSRKERAKVLCYRYPLRRCLDNESYWPMSTLRLGTAIFELRSKC